MESSKLTVRNKPIQIPNPTLENQRFILLNFVGYILLIFSVIDYAEILFPSQLTDPVWEFQTIEKLVEHVWSLLLGLTFVFIQQQDINKFKLRVLSSLSWLSFVLGLLYLLMLPLGINNSITIYHNSNAQISNQAAQQKEQFSKLSQIVNKANTSKELHNLDKIINPQNITPINDDTQELKNKLSQQLESLSLQVSNKAKSAKKTLANNLIKKAVKVNLGTVLTGVCLIIIWRLTCWTRIWRKWYV
ncbi:HpsJ family protein [Aetokthonos hydrillicola Thurmond2011]|jgi:hypothetical protein|uniref:HpsJ family protein n=2 Tax=Aetokthonos TaxID=1550243 RepID=A0AAP5I3A7_9CYAN|nr:HpsJ family protein [Aetokthonos hydrillicola]MBO3459249.1 hypothetical protein [Aetokthonos hydrillicola CCALA 1050]MBW4584918.1 HpsJ family protein [Aetokthonos hydrillicola CCALA 1050]MDR9894323.1 HpsJ family protein [Aetokthonos hydrillicola Thurmond2011]